MKTFIILVDNGYTFDYYCELEAVSWKEARKAFMKKHRGSYISDPKKFRVTEKTNISGG